MQTNTDAYCEKLDILVARLKEYLVESLKTTPDEYNGLLKQKERWITSQYDQWLTKEVKDKYDWVPSDVDTIDVMAILTCDVVKYIKRGGVPREDFVLEEHKLLSSLTTAES
jgi:hypothetical protein